MLHLEPDPVVSRSVLIYTRVEFLLGTNCRLPWSQRHCRRTRILNQANRWLLNHYANTQLLGEFGTRFGVNYRGTFPP